MYHSQLQRLYAQLRVVRSSLAFYRCVCIRITVFRARNVGNFEKLLFCMTSQNKITNGNF